jgi:hypothetical protein
MKSISMVVLHTFTSLQVKTYDDYQEQYLTLPLGQVPLTYFLVYVFIIDSFGDLCTFMKGSTVLLNASDLNWNAWGRCFKLV